MFGRLLLVACCFASSDAAITVLSTYDSGIFDDSAAEIVAYDPNSQRLFVTNAADVTVDILDFSDPATSLTKITSIQIPNGGPNSVAVSPDGSLVAVATEATNTQDPGTVEFYDIFGNSLGSTAVGSLPDMLTFTPDGNYVLVANEGEPNDDYTVDPEGSVSIIDVSSGLVSSFTVQTADFSSFNANPPAGVRIFGPGASVSQDAEPEYIVVSADSATAYVVLQENNAIAKVDIATATVTSVTALGCKDHSATGNELDPSNRDDAIQIGNWPVCGYYQPDSMAAFEVDGSLYIATANEGDARDYDGFSEEVRVDDLTLDPAVFPNAATLQMDENLGRLKTTTANGDTDNDGDVDVIYSYGARSFSIWNEDLSLVYDSGSDFEDKTAELIPDLFNASNDEDEADARSDDKGPEPEAITTGMLEGVLHAFIGLERVGGIMVRAFRPKLVHIFLTLLISSTGVRHF